MEKHTKYRIQVIDRAADLLSAIARYTEPVNLKILSAETGLHTSTTYRILSSLIQNKFVAKDAAGRYRLGSRLQQLSTRIQGNIDLRSIAFPVLEALRDELNESVHLTIREGDDVVYIEKASPNRMMQIQQMIGSRAPLHVTAVGKMVLGTTGNKGIEAYSQRTNLPMYTRNTINSVERLKQECFQALQDGYALDNEEAEIDVGCIGVLIYDHSNTAVAGLSISAPIGRRSNKWIKQVIEAGDVLSQQLGCQTADR